MNGGGTIMAQYIEHFDQLLSDYSHVKHLLIYQIESYQKVKKQYNKYMPDLDKYYGKKVEKIIHLI